MGLIGNFKSGFSRVPKHKRFDFIPRYYDEEEEKRNDKKNQRLKLQKGAFFNSKNKSRIAGAFTEREVVGVSRATGGQFMRVVVIAAMLFLIAGFLMGAVKSLATMAIATVGIIILMVLFVIRGNKI